MTLMIDNKSAIILSMNLVFHNRSKHTKTKFHFISTCLELDLESLGNELVDLFTKMFGR